MVMVPASRKVRRFFAPFGLALFVVCGGSFAHAATPLPEPPGETSTHFDAKARLGKKDMLATLQEDGHFGMLCKAIDAAGLGPYLKGHGPLTMFVPTDEAFAKLPAGTFDKWLKDPKTLKLVLRYHIIKAYVPQKQMIRLRNALTTNGLTARFDVTSGKDGKETIVINWEVAKVTQWDIWASNGVMHAIDAVLQLPKAAEKKDKKKDKAGSKPEGKEEAEPGEG